MSAGSHKHKWFLGRYVAARPVEKWEGGNSSLLVPTGEFYDSFSIFVCECGAKKEVVHKESK